MPRRKRNPRRGVSWSQLKDRGLLAERHVLMATELGFAPSTIEAGFHASRPEEGRLMLEWIEDLYFERHGRYYPIDEAATPERQQEHPAENSLLPDPGEVMNDYLRNAWFVPGSDDEPDDWYEEVGRRIEKSERETPASYGEIHEEDEAMRRRQSDFRKAASLLARSLGEMEEVVSVVLFGSVALPLWKEVPRFRRLRHRRIKIYHECATIDLAVRVTGAGRANEMRKACAKMVADLAGHGIHLEIAHHHFCLHLVDAAGERYLGMVCHYNRCPKNKEPCRVTGCGAIPFVRILPCFRLKPERLNEHNSMVLFAR